jgi:hypothetical protein
MNAFGLVWSFKEDYFDVANLIVGMQHLWTLIDMNSASSYDEILFEINEVQKSRQRSILKAQFKVVAFKLRVNNFPNPHSFGTSAIESSDPLTLQEFLTSSLTEDCLCLVGGAVSKEWFKIAVEKLERENARYSVQESLICGDVPDAKVCVWFSAPSSYSNCIMITSTAQEVIEIMREKAISIGNIEVSNWQELCEVSKREEQHSVFYLCDPVKELKKFP